MKTGATAKYQGLYYSECCAFETEFSEGQTFTRCPKCSGLTIWEVVDDDATQAA